MNRLDKIILNRIQSDFPIDNRPFKIIALELGLCEEEVISSVQRLKDTGIIRRIGGNFVPSKIGFVSTLCAAKVPRNKLEIFSDAVNQFSGVTHNYIRRNQFNVWFTFIAKTELDIANNLNKIKERTGIKEILNLPAIRVFKIRAEFDI